MGLYEVCAALANSLHVPVEENTESVSLIATDENTSLHITVPSFIRNDQRDRYQRSVFYISDLHLVHHIIEHFSEDVTDERIREYIHSIVLQLFDGEIGDAIRSFESPVVLFGGDVSSSFPVAEFFYRDFMSTWENIADIEYSRNYKELYPIRSELEPAAERFTEWKDKHPWFNNAQKPVAEYSDKKVPPEIKEIYARKEELEQQLEEKYEELNLSHSWESRYESSRQHKYVYSILGNHELWDFASFDACAAAYEKLFQELGISFLNDNCSSLGPYMYPYRIHYDAETHKNAKTLLQRNENPEEYDRQLFYAENIVVVGGLGFAGMNPSLNANQGIYGMTVNRNEELKRCKEWKNCVYKAVNLARENHCSLVVLSHTPVSDWLEHPEDLDNCFLFSGHTHRNVAYGAENNTFFFADNQVGYKGKTFRFKKAVLHLPRDPFASDPDGFREITCAEFKEYYRYVRDNIPGMSKIEQQVEQCEAKLYVIKQDGYVGFFVSSPRGVYICNGGVVRRIGKPESLDRYMANFMTMINKYITALTPLRRAQEQLSAYIKSIGGVGKIHGTIVDIDFFNHVMVNTNDGSLVYYYSPVFGAVKRYPDFRSLIHNHCPMLEAAFLAAGDTQLVPIAEALASEPESYERVDIRNSPYALSRRVNALQRLFEKRILRDWNPDLETITST